MLRQKRAEDRSDDLDLTRIELDGKRYSLLNQNLGIHYLRELDGSRFRMEFIIMADRLGDRTNSLNL